MTDRNQLFVSGFIGLAAAIITGTGEFLLHFDAEARFGEGLNFLFGIEETRTTWGHFLGVAGAPFYAIGAWHLCGMLKPASRFWAFALFFIMAYGCAMGGVWIGSRASISAIVNAPNFSDLGTLVALYELRYENLLQVMRAIILLISIIFVALILTGRTNYPRWMAFFNPIFLIIAAFLVFFVAPGIGKYLMPIALNVAFFVIFGLSLLILNKRDPADD